jgi:hypothetical protein
VGRVASAAETAEATRHEALINTALAAVPAAILCPYDASGLTAAVLEDARRTHPRVVEGGARRVSDDCSGTVVAQAIGGQPLPSPPPARRISRHCGNRSSAAPSRRGSRAAARRT